MDRRPRQCLRGDRGRARCRGVRQPQGRRHRGLPLRTRHQPHLPGLATHYDTAILPTRPRKPRDKAKVEVGVLIIERYVLARLRNRRFFLFELNVAIREIVADLNTRIMRKLGVSRLELLETVERQALKGLPSEPYQYAEWKKCRVAPDYHVEVERHYYSVPSRLIREQVEARITDTTIGSSTGCGATIKVRGSVNQDENAPGVGGRSEGGARSTAGQPRRQVFQGSSGGRAGRCQAADSSPN